MRPSEKEVYEAAWSHPEYRKVAPGGIVASVFLEKMAPPRGATLIDFGCGTGRGALELALLGGLDVTMLDIASNCLDEDVRHAMRSEKLRFVEADLSQGFSQTAEYGFCTDVMEHVPTEQVDVVLGNILKACKHVFFMICTVPDGMSGLVGHPLHLTVMPAEWWLEKLEDKGCTVRMKLKTSINCIFYVDTAWTN